MQLIKKLKSDLKEYTSIPFWSWNNELDEDELVRQIREFKAQSIDGFIMHARTGLKTEYLGEKWFKCIDACLKEAKRLDMQAWVYDENGWPSGFVGGRLLEDTNNLVRELKYEIKDFFDEKADYVYSLHGGIGKKLQKGDVSEKYHCIYVLTNDSYADILNPAVTDKFIAATHEEYYKRFSQSFGKELAGFFTDEPQYYRWGVPYTVVAEKEFRKAYGEDITESLIYLFIESDEANIFRTKYYRLLNKLYVDNFYVKIYDWCEKHNCSLTGHSIEETSLSGQMFGCAGVMPSYEYEQIPAIDWLGRNTDNPLSPKQLGSVARQLGKKQALTETFATCGWDATPRELRRIAEFQYVNGVNMMCQHLSSYSIKGQGKSDYPPSWSRHNPWINDSKPFNDYFKRLSYILCNTKEIADTLVIHPMRSAYLTYDRAENAKSVEKLNNGFINLCKELSAKCIRYHLGDETIISRHGKIENGKFVIGACSYENVIVPEMDSIAEETFELVNEFSKQGGKLAFCGKAPELIDGKKDSRRLSATANSDDIKPVEWLETDGNIYYTHRIGVDGEFVYAFNFSKSEPAILSCNRGCRILDLQKVEYLPSDGIIEIALSESVVLKIDDSFKSVQNVKKNTPTDVTDKFSFVSAGENSLTLDFVSVSTDGANFDKPVYCECANERLIKQEFNGKLWVKYCFDVEDVPKNASLLLEKLDYYSVSLNGNPLEIKDTPFDVFFGECDISGKIVKGINEIIAEIDYYQSPVVKDVLYKPDVKESLKNCLVIDTEIQSVYIKGDFQVDKDRKITAVRKVDGVYNLQEKGYPYLAGKAVFAGKISGNEKKNIKVTGRYMITEIKVNGKVAAKLILGDTADIGDYLCAKENEIEITLTPSLRNLMGPHHFKREPEPSSVGHFNFDFRNTWKEDGTSDSFASQYFCVPFGIEKIEIF